ncbi:MAG: hypothetical protein QOD01_2970 [Actinomycetota bacterium]|nr:hypothetical protein [Actinomycetota bacterium]
MQAWPSSIRSCALRKAEPAWSVALAEWLGVEFVTADERLAGSSGLRCAVRHLGGGQDDPGLSS